MSKGTLDAFFPPTVIKKPDSGIFVEERCSNPYCRKILTVKEPKYTLRIKGKEAPYCMACAKKILRPQEEEQEKELARDNTMEAY